MICRVKLIGHAQVHSSFPELKAADDVGSLRARPPAAYVNIKRQSRHTALRLARQPFYGALKNDCLSLRCSIVVVSGSTAHITRAET